MKGIKWFWGKAQSYIYMKTAIKSMSWVDLDVSGEASRVLFEQLFNCRVKDRDYVCVQKNIALLSIPSTYEEFVSGKPKQALRTNINKATKNGYHCECFNGLEYFKDIMEINCSSKFRGGKEMEEKYTDEKMVEEYLRTSPVLFGTFTEDGKLIAYIQLLRINKMLITNKILGHADFLENGLMYFMISQLVKSVIQDKDDASHIMYAKYLVGRTHAGYTYFKERCGFNGVNVRFHLHYGS